MKVFKRKQVVLVALVAMIALAGYFNWNYKNSDNGTVSDSKEMALGEARLVDSKNVGQDYFASSRMERETGRSKATESLKAIIDNPNADAESKKDAEERLIDMSGRMEKEGAAEAEIKAKGFSDCVVYINDSAVTAVVKSGKELTAADAAKIQEIIIRLTGADSANISISRYQ